MSVHLYNQRHTEVYIVTRRQHKVESTVTNKINTQSTEYKA